MVDTKTVLAGRDREGGTTGSFAVGLKAALELEQVRCWDCSLGTLH